MSLTIFEGMIIGGAGGAIAGLVIKLVQLIIDVVGVYIHKRKIFGCLFKRAVIEKNNKFVHTLELSYYTNLAPDRIRYICSIHKKIMPLRSLINTDSWALREWNSEGSVVRENGIG